VAAAHDLPHDRGGNLLFLPIGNGQTLHGYWDSQLGNDGLAMAPVAATPDLRDRFVRKLQAMIQRGQGAGLLIAGGATASPEGWLAEWAGEALQGARSAYQTLVIAHPRQSGDGYVVDWEGRAAYDARCGPIATGQLTKAGHNLAALLNAIWS
jgi:hypothetical protein